MNCREAKDLIYAERDSAPDNPRCAALEGHVAHCAGCQRIRADLAAALAAWRTETEHVVVPAAEREWHAVRRRIRGGVDAGAVVRLEPQRPGRNLLAWLAVPVGAAAVLVFTLFTGSTSTHPVGSAPPSSHPGMAVAASAASTTPLVASAESIEVPGNNASTMVFVDEKSGWLMVWASDEKPKQG